MPDPTVPRIVFLYAAPLDQTPLDFGYERERVSDALREAGRAVEIVCAPATADDLRRLLTPGCRVLHYSGHGHPDFLAFEDGRGGTQALPSETLKRLCAAGGESGVRLAFVSACHSRKAGDALVAAGVPHVVAVHVDDPVCDEAAREFARHFYLALAVGQTVAQAFAIGQEMVAALPGMPSGEAGKFLLLPDHGNHDAAVLADALPGDLVDATPSLPPDNLPALTEHFLGRAGDLGKTVWAVLDGRLVTLRGAPGIGKTTLATAAARYLHERRHFKDGVFFVSLRDAASSEKARALLADATGVRATTDAELFAGLRDKQILFVLDNAEDVLAAPDSGIHAFLDGLLGRAGRVKLLVTSRRAIGGGVTSAAENVLPLTRLADQDAKTLFRRLADAARSRPLTNAEADSSDVAEILRLLGGNPHALRLAAPRLETWNLARLRQELDAVPMDVLLVADVPLDQLDSVKSLAKSLSVSVGYVRSASPEAVGLFGVMGLLPSGAFGGDLDAIWGEGWRPLMDVLVRASLVERAEVVVVEHFSTFPLVTYYAERLLTSEDLSRFSSRVNEHFAKASDALYPAMVSADAAGARLAFAFMEQNLWACLSLNRLHPPKRPDEEVTPAGRITTQLPAILLLCCRFRDGLQAAQDGREVCRAIGDTIGEGSALYNAGSLASALGNAARARADYEAALTFFRSAGSVRGEANVWQSLGMLALDDNDWPMARRAFETALQLHRQGGSHYGEANALEFLGKIAAAEGDAVTARCNYNTALLRHRDSQNRLGEANCHRNLAKLLHSEEKVDEATHELKTALTLHISIGHTASIASDLSDLADIMVTVKRFAIAVVICEPAILNSRNISSRSGELQALKQQATALMGVDEIPAGVAVMYQMRNIYRELQSANADKLDQALARMQAHNDPAQ